MSGVELFHVALGAVVCVRNCIRKSSKKLKSLKQQHDLRISEHAVPAHNVIRN